MSQINSQGSQNATPDKKNKTIYLAVVLVLLVACVYLFISKNKMASENEQAAKVTQVQLDSVKSSRDALQTDFDAASAKIDQLVSEQTRADSTLQTQRTELAKLQVRIRHILNNKNATEKELKDAREMIASLTDKTKQYEDRIATLEKENTELKDKNQALAKEVDSTVTENIGLKKVASVMHVSNLRLEPLHVRKNGKEKETSKAKRVNVMRVKFDIDQNQVAESGQKHMYVRIIGPDGKLLTAKSNTAGAPVDYTVEKDVTVNQNQLLKDVTVDWNQENDYPKGRYTIEIYNDGYKVGAGDVMLKQLL